MIQWFRICFAMQRMWVPPKAGELGSHMLCGNKAHTPQLESLQPATKDPAWTIPSAAAETQGSQASKF